MLDEGADLAGYEVKECTASGAIHGSRMVEVIRGKKKYSLDSHINPLNAWGVRLKLVEWWPNSPHIGLRFIFSRLIG